MNRNSINIMRQIKHWALLGFALWAMGSALAVQAAEAEDRAATQAVIEAQLAAFRQDEGAKAFSLASPDIQRVFESAENFMHMVKSNYRVVYRHAQIKFLTYKGNELIAQHTVQMVDENNALWSVLYTLQKMKDGSWRISSCETSKALGDLI